MGRTSKYIAATANGVTAKRAAKQRLIKDAQTGNFVIHPDTGEQIYIRSACVEYC